MFTNIFFLITVALSDLGYAQQTQDDLAVFRSSLENFINDQSFCEIDGGAIVKRDLNVPSVGRAWMRYACEPGVDQGCFEEIGALGTCTYLRGQQNIQDSISSQFQANNFHFITNSGVYKVFENAGEYNHFTPLAHLDSKVVFVRGTSLKCGPNDSKKALFSSIDPMQLASLLSEMGFLIQYEERTSPFYFLAPAVFATAQKR